MAEEIAENYLARCSPHERAAKCESTGRKFTRRTRPRGKQGKAPGGAGRTSQLPALLRCFSQIRQVPAHLLRCQRSPDARFFLWLDARRRGDDRNRTRQSFDPEV